LVIGSNRTASIVTSINIQRDRRSYKTPEHNPRVNEGPVPKCIDCRPKGSIIRRRAEEDNNCGMIHQIVATFERFDLHSRPIQVQQHSNALIFIRDRFKCNNTFSIGTVI